MQLDAELFLLINQWPHNQLFDFLALLLSGIGKGGVIWFMLGIVLFFREEKKNHWFFLPIFLAGGISWILVEKVIKPFIGRPRPPVDVSAIVVGSLPSDPSFPSGHATIAFAMAYVLSRRHPRWRIYLYILAALISLSRVYLGVHYPLDVLGGAILGLGIGAMIYYIGAKVQRETASNDRS